MRVRSGGTANVPAPDGGNPFGLVEVLAGYAAAVVLALVAVAIEGALTGRRATPSSFGGEVADLVGEWIGFFGAAVFASVHWHRSAAARVGASDSEGAERASVVAQVRRDYGISLRWWDVPLGIAAGLGSQYLLVPAFEAILLPFVPHLYQRLGGPANELTSPAHGTAELAVLGVLICVGSPLFEEIFFRGLLLRALVGRLAVLGRRVGDVLAIVLSAAIFGLVHYEALQFLGLFGFGLVLAVLARRTGRLGAGIVAHLTFNAVTVLAIALAR